MIRAISQYEPFAFFAISGGMKPAEIKERLKRSGSTQAALARAIGKSKDSVSRLLTGQRSMDADEAEAIRDFFAIGREEGPQFIQIPVYGYAAAGGEDRVAFADEYILDRIEVPMGLVRGDAVAIRVAGESMEPRLYSGETVIVGLGVPPRRNGDCVVELRDGSALVKQYVATRDNVVYLHQLNPDKEIRVDATKVKAIHSVIYRR
ncbi:S24 family peptidase [Brevundimonas sp.]|uniref:LexA family transcriptional regulator n=1 Tax=Brevundimonas sp. TaxID=1871086 RepID=UPI00289EC115|nr:S24 family peptidase [Brevundimonas sp.]